MTISEKRLHNSTFINIKNDVGLEIELCSMGAAIYSIRYGERLLTFAPEDKELFLHNLGYYGKTVGRIAGRVKDGLLKIHDKTYQLDINEHGKNTLHSGKASWAFVDFKFEIKEEKNGINIIFTHFSKALEGGFPGDAFATITYFVYFDKPQFELIHHVDVSEDTIIALTNHAYYSIAKPGNTVLDHYLTIPADKYIHVDDLLILQGEVPVNEVFDFRTKKKIGDGEFKAKEMYKGANGYDHTFILEDHAKTNPIELENDGIIMKIYTDYPAVNCYGNCYNNDTVIYGHGENLQYAAIAIEPQMCLLRNEDLIVTKNKPYHHESTYIFERK